MNLQIAICLPRDAEAVSLVRAVAVDALRRLGVTTDCTDDVRLALSEACNNVIQHAPASDEYEVRLEVRDDGRCEVSVRDPGGNLDPGETAGVMPGPHAADGRGIAMMRALTDQAEFSSSPEAGTVVQLVKQLVFDPDSPLDLLSRSR